MARFGTVDVVVDVKHELVLGTTPDGQPEVWLLYQPEPCMPDSIEEREMHLWMRRCDVFSSRERAIAHLDALLGKQIRWARYADLTGGWFPELWLGTDGIGHRWWMCPAPLDPTGGSHG